VQPFPITELKIELWSPIVVPSPINEKGPICADRDWITSVE